MPHAPRHTIVLRRVAICAVLAGAGLLAGHMLPAASSPLLLPAGILCFGTGAGLALVVRMTGRGVECHDSGILAEAQAAAPDKTVHDATAKPAGSTETDQTGNTQR